MHWIESVNVELCRGPKVVRVIGHVKHGVMSNRPSDVRGIRRTVYEDGMLFIDAASNLGVPASAEDRCCASIGVDAGEVGRGEEEAPALIFDGLRGAQKERAGGLVKTARLSAEYQCAELKS